MRQTIVCGFVAWIVLAPPASTAPQGYSMAETVELVRSLGEALEMPGDKLDDLTRNLKTVSADPWHATVVAGRPVSAVFVYRSTEAGLIYKRRSGSGLAAFTRSAARVPVKLSGSSLGASIGGAAEWGVGLVLGLKEDRHFGGTYEGDERSATAIDSTTPVAALFSNRAYVDAGRVHDVLFVVAARGLSAGVSTGKVTITPEW
jgi:hypothetical protein